MFEKELVSFGLTDGEAKAYVALLGLGQSTVGPIAKKSFISYSKIYEVLQRLMDKGLVSSVVRQNTRVYQAVEPERIREYLEKQEQEITERKAKFGKLLPEMNRLVREAPRSDVEMFTGFRGLRAAFDLFMKDVPKGAVLYFTYVAGEYDEKTQMNIDKFYSTLPYYSQYHWRGIASKGYKFSDFTKDMHRMIEFREVNVPLPGNMAVSNDCFMQTALSGSPVVILTRSREMASTARKYCDSLWEIATSLKRTR